MIEQGTEAGAGAVLTRGDSDSTMKNKGELRQGVFFGGAGGSCQAHMTESDSSGFTC